MEQEGLNVGYLAYNTQMKPFDDPRVRKALNMAIDKQAIIDAVFQGTGKIAKNPIPPTMWSYDESTVDDPYDPGGRQEAARGGRRLGAQDEDLGDAGAAALQPQRPPHGRADPGRLCRDRRRGRDRVMEWGEYLKQSSALDRDGAVLLGWTGDNGDPDNFLAVLLGCDGVGANNRAQWCYQPFEDLIQKAKGTSDQEARTDLYEEAQKVFKEQAPWATIAHSLATVPMSNKVSGFIQDPLGSHLREGRHRRVGTAEQSRGAGTSPAPRRQPGTAVAASRSRPPGPFGQGMLGFLLRRIGLLIPTFLGVSFLAFMFIRVLPGDPILLMAGERGVRPERYQELLHRYGFDRSISSSTSSISAISSRATSASPSSPRSRCLSEFMTLFPATLELSLCAMIIAVVIGVPAVIAARAAAAPRRPRGDAARWSAIRCRSSGGLSS